VVARSIDPSQLILGDISTGHPRAATHHPSVLAAAD
jgi:hypothetical protein